MRAMSCDLERKINLKIWKFENLKILIATEYLMLNDNHHTHDQKTLGK